LRGSTRSLGARSRTSCARFNPSLCLRRPRLAPTLPAGGGSLEGRTDTPVCSPFSTTSIFPRSARSPLTAAGALARRPLRSSVPIRPPCSPFLRGMCPRILRGGTRSWRRRMWRLVIVWMGMLRVHRKRRPVVGCRSRRGWKGLRNGSNRSAWMYDHCWPGWQNGNRGSTPAGR